MEDVVERFRRHVLGAYNKPPTVVVNKELWALFRAIENAFMYNDMRRMPELVPEFVQSLTHCGRIALGDSKSIIAPGPQPLERLWVAFFKSVLLTIRHGNVDIGTQNYSAFSIGYFKCPLWMKDIARRADVYSDLE